MSGYYETIGCPCPAVLNSETLCSYVNDKISINFSAGKYDYKTLKVDYPELDLDKQQLYIYKPSDLFEKSVDAFITQSSSGRDNLQCSYELFDECYTSAGISDGCLITLDDSFACIFDPKKMQKGFLDHNDSTSAAHVHSSRMPLSYKNGNFSNARTFRHILDVGNNPGTYCVNVTTFEIFNKPIIRFWNQTPLTEDYPQMILPLHTFLSWIIITSISLIVVGVFNLFYKDGWIGTRLILFCLVDNLFEIVAIFADSDQEIGESVCSVLALILGIPVMFIVIPLIIALEIPEHYDDSLTPLIPFLLTKVYHFIVKFVLTFIRKSVAYSTIGSIMNNLVFYKYDDQVLFYITLTIDIIACGISLKIATVCPLNSRKDAVRVALLAILYFVLCRLIEFSFVLRKAEFLDNFFEDPLVIIYSRLDDILVMAYICGNFLWNSFQKHYQLFRRQPIALPEGVGQ